MFGIIPKENRLLDQARQDLDEAQARLAELLTEIERLCETPSADETAARSACARSREVLATVSRIRFLEKYLLVLGGPADRDSAAILARAEVALMKAAGVFGVLRPNIYRRLQALGFNGGATEAHTELTRHAGTVG